MDVPRDITKTIGKKLDNVLNGTHKGRVLSHFFLYITERMVEQSVSVMSRMVMCFGMKLPDVIEYIHK